VSNHHVKYLLLGGGLASSAALGAIREVDPAGSCLLVGQEVLRPYDRTALSRDYLLGRRTRADIFTIASDWYDRHEVHLRTGRRAAHLDTTRRAVTLDSAEEITFEKLLIATGAAPLRLRIHGADLPNVFNLRTLDDADRLHHAIEQARQDGRRHARGRGRALVVGAGLLGVELAVTLLGQGLEVDLVEAQDRPWPRYSGEVAGRFLAKWLEQRGVRLHLRNSPQRLEGDGRVQRALLGDGSVVDCDFVVAAIGVIPNKELLRGTSIMAEKAILVDCYCQTSHADIYAAGDCAAIFDPLFGKYRHLDHWQSALDMGRLAGLNMAGARRGYDQVNCLQTTLQSVPVRIWGEGRLVERRLVRGCAAPDEPDFMEIGVAADGRVTQVLAVGPCGQSPAAGAMVRQRLSVHGQEDALRDPAVPLPIP
jgi:NADPH-dependent 2,4-dienoyl-CoA reductase/sulfur reductase-like enzyme